MPADEPTVLATSANCVKRDRDAGLVFTPMLRHALELAGVDGRAPRLCFVGTAAGDQQHIQSFLSDIGQSCGVTVTHLDLFPMPNVPDPTGHLLDQDAVWVNGGSVANLLVLWRLHGWDAAFRQAWQHGVVLAGGSAGSICWHAGGTTDSFGPDLRPINDGLGFLPYSNCVHYDSQDQRRPQFQSLIASGELPDGYATDDSAGLVYRGTGLVEAVTEQPDRLAYAVVRDGDGAREEPLPMKVLTS